MGDQIRLYTVQKWNELLVTQGRLLVNRKLCNCKNITIGDKYHEKGGEQMRRIIKKKNCLQEFWSDVAALIRKQCLRKVYSWRLGIYFSVIKSDQYSCTHCENAKRRSCCKKRLLKIGLNICKPRDEISYIKLKRKLISN